MYWCHAVDKGYAGTAVFSREKPLNVTYGINTPRFDTEGRIITAEYPEFYLVNAYIPNSGMKLERLKYKQEYDAAFLACLKTLEKTKPVIVCGDLNARCSLFLAGFHCICLLFFRLFFAGLLKQESMQVAHQEIDVYEPEKKSKIAGFTPQERADFSRLLDSGFVDTFRHLHPTDKDRYCFWSYRIRGREYNLGVCVSKLLSPFDSLYFVCPDVCLVDIRCCWVCCSFSFSS